MSETQFRAYFLAREWTANKKGDLWRVSPKKVREYIRIRRGRAQLWFSIMYTGKWLSFRKVKIAKLSFVSDVDRGITIEGWCEK